MVFARTPTTQRAGKIIPKKEQSACGSKTRILNEGNLRGGRRVHAVRCVAFLAERGDVLRFCSKFDTVRLEAALCLLYGIPAGVVMQFAFTPSRPCSNSSFCSARASHPDLISIICNTAILICEHRSINTASYTMTYSGPGAYGAVALFSTLPPTMRADFHLMRRAIRFDTWLWPMHEYHRDSMRSCSFATG